MSISQLEESEFTCAAAVKARKSMEVEMEDLHVQMEDISKAKQAVCVIFFLKKCSSLQTIHIIHHTSLIWIIEHLSPRQPDAGH